jgi:hypothetical protein
VLQFSRLGRQNTIGEELLFEGEQHKQAVLSTIGINHKRREKPRHLEALPETKNQGSKILCQEGQTRNSNTPLPPAKGKIKSKPGIHAKREQNVQFANCMIGTI